MDRNRIAGTSVRGIPFLPAVSAIPCFGLLLWSLALASACLITRHLTACPRTCLPALPLDILVWVSHRPYPQALLDYLARRFREEMLLDAPSKLDSAL